MTILRSRRDTVSRYLLLGESGSEGHGSWRQLTTCLRALKSEDMRIRKAQLRDPNKQTMLHEMVKSPYNSWLCGLLEKTGINRASRLTSPIANDIVLVYNPRIEVSLFQAR